MFTSPSRSSILHVQAIVNPSGMVREDPESSESLQHGFKSLLVPASGLDSVLNCISWVKTADKLLGQRFSKRMS